MTVRTKTLIRHHLQIKVYYTATYNQFFPDHLLAAQLGNDLEALAEQQHARALERYNYCVEHEIWSGMLEILQTKPESHECATLLLQNMYATANWYGKEFPEEEEFVEQQVRDAVARAELRASEENERARASHHRGQSMPSNTSVRDMAMMFSTHQEDGSEGVRMT